MESSLGHALYLHPIEQSGTYIYNSKDELITRSGAPLPNDGNLLHADHSGAETRGAKYTDVSLTNAFGVSAVLTNTTNNTNSSYFQNLKATPNGGSWVTSEAKYWPTDGALSFYAYYPYSTDSHNMLSENAAVDVANAKTVHYVASATDIVNQPDLIVANHLDVTHGSTEAPNSVSLTFSHVLTAITFAVGSDMAPGTVKSIAIKGVRNTGDYDLSTGQWKTSGADADFTISLGGGNGTKVNGTQDVALTSGAQTLMMIPQTFTGDNSKVEILFHSDKDNQDHTLSVSLKGTQWDAGSTIIYKVSTSSLMSPLKLNTVTFPTDWSQKYTAGTLKSSYAQGDKMGLYIVDQSGLVREANVELTCNGTTWEFPKSASLRLNPGCQYFTYYPYQTSPQGGLQKGETVNVATLADANTFFKKLEDAWTPKTDQSNKDNLNASDLQVAKAVINNTASGINLTMGHAMGLADITLSLCSCYRLSTDHNYTFNEETVSDNFVNNIPFKLTGAHYIEIVKSGSTTIFKAQSTDVKYAWKSDLSFNPSKAEVVEGTALPNKQELKDYTLAIGDVYYSDGSLSHHDDPLLAGKTKAGVVAYIARGNDDYWVEKDTKKKGIGGHALVICSFQTAASSWSNDIPLFDGSKQIVYEYGTNSAQIFLSHANDIHGSGYLNTQYLLKLDGDYTCFPARTVNSYNNGGILHDKSTGYFIPSVGQVYACMATLCGATPEKEAATNRGVTDGNGTNSSDFFDNPVIQEQAIRKYLGNISYYSWTSSFASQYFPWMLDHLFPPGCSLRHDASITYPAVTVRPFLAF